jgi:hypothetical protein
MRRVVVTPVIRFDTFAWSYINTFLILTGEGWPGMFYMAFRASYMAVPYFVVWIVLGQYILLNLVVVSGGRRVGLWEFLFPKV